MSDTKKCEGCGKDVPVCVITCDDCTFARIAAPGVTKAEWVKSLVTKSAKSKEKPKRAPRKTYNKPTETK
jgi:hypothetical protein